jgi:hypothetical protein
VKNHSGHKKGEKKQAQNQVELGRAELWEESCRAQKKVKKDKPERQARKCEYPISLQKGR